MMKWITIIFLLANVGYFGWQMNQKLDQAVSTTAAEEIPRPASSTPLVLLSERDTLPPLRKNSLIEDVEIDVSEKDVSLVSLDENGNITSESLPFNSEGACFSIGPYASVGESADLTSWLQGLKQPFRQRIEEKRTRERYWVYLEPQTEAAAKAQMQELENKGLTDYYMISKGNMKNAISLGLFSSQDSVNRRLLELKREGYSPVVVPQHKISNIYWIDAQLDSGLTPPNLPEGKNISNIDCLDIALLDSDH